MKKKQNTDFYCSNAFTYSTHKENQFCSVAQLCPILCDPVDCSMPGFPVYHQLPELALTHATDDAIEDAIQSSHPLSSPSLPAFNPSQHQVFSNESVLRIRWPKYLSFSISPSNEYSGLRSFRTDWFDLLGVQGERIVWKDINIELSLLP